MERKLAAVLAGFSYLPWTHASEPLDEGSFLRVFLDAFDDPAWAKATFVVMAIGALLLLNHSMGLTHH